MKFAHKMICLLVLVLSASFGLGGCWLLYSDFAVQRRTVLTADAALHSQICTDVQTDLLDRQRRGLEMDGAVEAARLADPKNIEVLFRAAELNSRLKNKTAAIDNLALILAQFPSRQAAGLARALSEELGRYDDALEYQEQLEAMGSQEEQQDFMCELNVLEQVANVCYTTIV